MRASAALLSRVCLEGGAGGGGGVNWALREKKGEKKNLPQKTKNKTTRA
jgi:hypothetical protein